MNRECGFDVCTIANHHQSVGPGGESRGGEMQLDSVHMAGRTLKLADGLDGRNPNREGTWSKAEQLEAGDTREEPMLEEWKCPHCSWSQRMSVGTGVKKEAGEVKALS